MAETTFLGIDLGAESGRCVTGTLADGQFSFTEQHRFPNRTLDYRGTLHWDVLDQFREIKNGIAKAVEETGALIQSVSVDTWAVDYVLLDRDRRVLGYPYHYRDVRTEGMVKAATQVMDRKRLHKLTGSFFKPINTLYQLLAEQRQTDSLLETADQLAMMPNFFLFLLSGELVAEYTDASTTQLTNPNTRDWCEEVMQAFDLPEDLFPDIVEPGTTLGTVEADVREETGLNGDTSIIAGPTHDTAAAVAAVPADGENWAFLSSGTWSLLGVERDEPLITEAAREHDFTNEGGVNGTIRFLKNIIGLWPLQECRRTWANQGHSFEYDELTEMARDRDPVEAWVDLEDDRFFQPGNMPKKIRAYLEETGQQGAGDPGWVTRCLLESLALQYRTSLQELEDVTDRAIETLHIVGGGVRNELLTRWTADATRVQVIAGPVEATVIGNIGHQAITSGHLRDLSEMRNLIERSCDPDVYLPENTGYWDTHASTYRSLQEDV